MMDLSYIQAKDMKFQRGTERLTDIA